MSWGNNPRRRTSDSYWRSPMRWESHASAFFAKYGRRQRVFCASLADVFDNKVDVAWRSGLFGLIRSTPSLDWLLLTKRPQNIVKMLPGDWLEPQHLNVWLGITAENQRFFDQRWPILASVPAAIRFVSYEPALGALRLRLQDDVVRPDWLISGGESGGGARPLNPLWIRDIITDCERLGVAAFHKQWGMYRNNPLCCEDGRLPCEAKALDSYGKGGALVDGKLYRRFPIAPNPPLISDRGKN